MSTRVELRAVNDPSCSSFRWFDPSRDRQRLCDSEQARLFSKPHPPLLPFPSLSWVIRILFPPPPPRPRPLRWHRVPSFRPPRFGLTSRAVASGEALVAPALPA